MRLLLFLLAICVGIIDFGNRAVAQNYPWCAQYSGNGVMNCGFTTFQQCLAEVSGVGGFCTQNSTYQPPPVLRPRARRTRTSLR
jgi:Protein of unknown function (DUF3551)